MKNLSLVLFGAILALGITSSAAVVKYNPQEAANRNRAPVPVIGAAEEVTATAAASDAATLLNGDSMYLLTCDTQAYVRWCANATCTAAAGDFKLAADTLFVFATTDTLRGFAAKSVAVNGSCWLLEMN